MKPSKETTPPIRTTAVGVSPLLRAFWDHQMREVDEAVDFKNHNLPLSCIKKIMKVDEEVHMISAEAPVLFAKACEMFVKELTLRSWIHTEEGKRRTMRKNDVAVAVSRSDVFDFLVDIISRDELEEGGVGIETAVIPLGGPSCNSLWEPSANPHVT